MMTNKTKVLIENIIVPHRQGVSGPDADRFACDSAAKRVKKLLGISPEKLFVHRKSIDARRKKDIKLVYSICAEVPLSAHKVSHKAAGEVKLYSEANFSVEQGTEALKARPVIVGFGPAGMFCALALAERGYRPVVYERGASVEDRVAAVEGFVSSGVLDVNSNIQFGAGGAGTFSDGKLTTRINDPLCSYVLSKLVELGAPEDILTKAKPHIGTDVLREVVARADARIRKLGGEIYYNSKVSIDGTTATIRGENLPYGALVLALGHSARDTYEELLSSGYLIEAKPYSVGVRIEHLQRDLDFAMHGDFAGDVTLGPAEYNVSYREGDRGVYSFCMCPGGEVVGAASEEGGVVTNGMSRRLRDGDNANAALAVSVKTSDYGNTPRLAIDFQRSLERRAFAAGGNNYAAPLQTVGDFLAGKRGTSPDKIKPTYMNGKYTLCDLNTVLPSFVCEMLKAGLIKFGQKINGFDRADVPMTGVETRTSAPVRIMRGETFTAVSKDLVYPCGEGAGYAGGIMSAAIDGLRVARAIIERFKAN